MTRLKTNQQKIIERKAMKTYKSSEFRKIQTPHPYGDPDRQYYRHKKYKFKLVFLDMTTGFEKERGIPSNYVAHVCSQDGEPDHDEIIISDPQKMAKLAPDLRPLIRKRLGEGIAKKEGETS